VPSSTRLVPRPAVPNSPEPAVRRPARHQQHRALVPCAVLGRRARADWPLLFAAIQVCWARGQDSADSSLQMCHPQDPRAPIDGEEAVRAASVGSVVVSRATPRVRMEYDSGRSAFFCAPDADREPPSHSLRQRRRSQLVISRTGEGKGSGSGRDAPRQPATGRLSTRSPEVLRRQGRRRRHPAVA